MSGKSAERLLWEDRAEKAGVKFAANIGDEKLQARVLEAEAEANTTTGGASEGPGPVQGAEPGTSASTQSTAGQTGPAAEKSGEGEGDGAGAAQGTVAPATPEGDIVIVTGPKRGRWRAGRRFTREPSSIPLAELDQDELAAIEGDPRLSVEYREGD